MSDATVRALVAERNWLRRRVEALFDAHVALEGRYAELVVKLQAMQRDGWRPSSEPPSREVADPLPDAVVRAIGARAIDRDTARDMEQWARAQLAAEVTVEDVVGRLWRGDEGL